ncbi:uncharacterized protein LOC110825560 [Carica papaya]|uniref:uncharacterized protein LOC110825560 n=1 Tax=Carica papaya TaxID=3649 RepID=UPI000B8C7A9F|nr:uncharacterized protein LOC110825560 [Carica papaya]XP_021911719.1 uncharacterized protein LOC110825560 [Carica papaya]
MGFYGYIVAGGCFILIGAWESLASSNSNPNTSPSSPVDETGSAITSADKSKMSSSSLTFIAISVVSFLFILNSLLSLFDALNSRDRVGSVLQLQVLVIALLFLFYAVLGFFVNFKTSFHLPCSLLNLIALFGFLEEFVLFYMQRKDPSGIENRYFDLLLVPVTICVFSTILEFKLPTSNYPRLARGSALILQGTWFLQMGVSFYTNWMVQGCSLHQKSRGNFTVKCKGHPEYHRGRGIATLQFNCHLALLVVLTVGLYSIMARKYGDGSDFSRYRPLGAEMRQMENMGNFTLDSDEDDGIRDEDNAAKEGAIVETGVNGFGSHK